MRRIHVVVALLLIGHASSKVSDEETDSCEQSEDTCAIYDEAGPWSATLKEWAVTHSAHTERHGRIMSLPSNGYYVSDRIDLAPPPPPQHHSAQQQHHASQQQNRPAPPKPHHNPTSNHKPHHKKHSTPMPTGRPPTHDEWQVTPPPSPNAGKIVNKPSNTHKDKFRPSPAYNPPNQPIPLTNPQHTMVDRVDENKQTPQKQVSETDLYLLGAIEKLVYRVDLMEKRLRKMEESVHYLVAGVDKKPDPCPTNFTRIADVCYHISVDTANWKGANYACRKLKANMLELDTEDERNKLMATLLSDKKHRGADFWTGGLNPGLLWIWSHSARPVASNSSSTSVLGEGRCLAWVSDPALRSYVFRGRDCALRHRYVCEREDDKDKLSNEISRVARMLHDKSEGRKPKIVWTMMNDDAP